MADEWGEEFFGDLTDNFDSVRVPVKQSERRAGPYPYYGASGKVDHVDDYLFDGQHLLIAEDGENLRTRQTPITFLANGKFWVNNHAHIVRGNHKADTHFLMYALSQIDISGYLTGSTMPKLTQGNLNRISLRTPPIPEQRAIAHILGTLDEKIELNRRMNETLEAMARALFKSWFVDFDPVRAKTAGQDTGLPQHIADRFPDHLFSSDLGEVPAKWCTYTIDDLAQHHTGSIAPSASPNSQFEHFSIPAYDAGQTPIVEHGADIKSNKTAFPKGAILLSKLNPDIPRVWIPDQRSSPAQICSTEFLAFTPSACANKSLLYSLFSDEAFRTTLRSMVTGTSKSHQRVPPKALKSQQVLSGTVTLFHLFGELTNPWLEKTIANRAESQTLARIRGALLPRLMSGELRVSEAEKAVEAVT